MWGTFLSEPLRIVGLVGRYPANCLMRRMPIRSRIAPLTPKGCPLGVLRGIRPDFSGLSPCCGQVAYVLLTRAPVAGKSQQADSPAAPRLACVKPVASVHPEPGSNSPLLVSCLFSFLNRKATDTSKVFVAVATAPRLPVSRPCRSSVPADYRCLYAWFKELT